MNLFKIMQTLINMPLLRPWISVLAIIFSLLIPLFLIESICYHIKKRKLKGRRIDLNTAYMLQDLKNNKLIHESNVRERQRIPTNFRLYEFIRSLFI